MLLECALRIHVNNKDLILVILLLLSSRLSNAVMTDKPDAFTSFREMSKTGNPTRNIKPPSFTAEDLYQPYYVCGADDDVEALSLNEWHYSCKQSCSDTNNRHLVNITRMRWDYVGVSTDAYKINTYKTCWVSHVNVWGACSHSQTIVPVPTTDDDAKFIRERYFKKDRVVMKGMQHILNSKKASCSYFSDIEYCARDYDVYHKLGRLSKKSDHDDTVLNIYSDGIRVDPKDGILHLNDVAYIWDPKIETTSTECGWKEGADATCTMIETSDVLKCDDIGYSYNIHDTINITTCGGEIYDIDGPSPFKYITKEEMEDRDTVVQKVKEGKPDPDISFITGINYALSELETTYCSSMCDLFSKIGKSTQDHVLDTPIGAWRLQLSDPLHPKMLPCKPTADWRIKYPFQMCNLANSILVEDSTTNHVNLWDARKDYIILDQLCGGKQDSALGRGIGALKSKIVKQEDFEIEFWNGDIVSVTPPYEKTIWKRGAHSFRSNPSWFTKVKLDTKMIHTKDDISIMLTEYVSNMTREVRYDRTEGKTVYRFLAEEIIEGVESVGSSVWSGVSGFFGNITKIFTLLLLVIIAFLILRAILLLKKVMRNKKRTKNNKVRFELADQRLRSDISDKTDEYNVDYSDVEIPRSGISRADRRSKRKNLEKLVYGL